MARCVGTAALLLAAVPCPRAGRSEETGPGAAAYWKPAPSQVVANAVPYAARPLPLAAVRLTGGPLKQAQDLDAAYLLQLEPDRMLFFLRQRAGLPPRATEGYGGWDGGGGRQLTGHFAGHYLSAVSYMFAATSDGRFKERADYLVRELKEIQDKQGDGYIGALRANAAPGSPEKFVDGKPRFEALATGVIQSSDFDLNGMWSPWYVEHKLFAGLRDAYRMTGNRLALEVETRFAGWADGILHGLNEAQIQKMLAAEFGGMNEVTADLYADTGNKRWLDLSDRFEHRAVVDPLARREDHLGGLHANTQVPKMLGELARYAYNGNREEGTAAEFFWDAVAYHHSFATGGHSKDEHFGPRDRLNLGIDGRTAETCNVYNLLKMTRMLFALRPDAAYAEFQERALFNHILGSIDQSGRTCYMVPVGRGVTREYQNMFADFTCCMGTGMESHALHGDGIYDESGRKLWVNLYAPSTVRWEAVGATLDVQTNFPEGEAAKVTVGCPSPATFTLALRRPSWAGDGFAVTVNGEELTAVPPPGTYVEVTREWHDGDAVSLTLPKALHTEPLPDNPQRMAVLWGPLVLAGDLGPADKHAGANKGSPTAPAFVTDSKDVADWVKPVAGKPGTFRTEKVGLPTEVELVPFYRLQHRLYAVYWDVFSAQEWATRQK